MSAVIATINQEKHKFIIISILLDISKNEILRENLVLKGGTYLYLFYKLDRFSTDLDFDFIGNVDENIVLGEIKKIVSKYGNVKESIIKKHTIFTLLSYGDIEHNIKIEVSRRGVDGEYSIKNFMGMELNVLDIEYATANKFFALTDRNKLASRDIYDVRFILKNMLPINKEYLAKITGKSFENYIKYMLEFLEKLPKNYNILDGLGTTLDEKQKNFAKTKMKDEILGYLRFYL